MISTEIAESIVGFTAYDSAGDKLGKVGQVYFDDTTGQAAWITVRTGLFGTKESFVPLANADVTGDDDVTLAYPKDKIQDAPRVDADEHLSIEEEDTLYRYYGLGDGGSDSSARFRNADTGSAGEAPTGRRRGDGHDTSGTDTDDAMTRSEEQLRVGTQRVETGRARLRKYVVTEDVATTVPVSHEEVRVEREPITDANRDAALSGGDLTSDEHEVTLHAEQPVVEKETVPVERVRLATDTVTDEEKVNEQVRKEEITTDGIDRSTDNR